MDNMLNVIKTKLDLPDIAISVIKDNWSFEKIRCCYIACLSF